MKLANRYGLDVAVYKEVDGTSKKVCSIDFANEVSIELSSEVSWATGEQTHRRIVGFGNPIEGTMTIQTQLVTNELLACIAGMAEVSSRIGFSNKTMQGVKYVLKCTTIWVSETGETRVENITVCNAVPKKNYSVNYSGDGEPQSIEVTFEMIADENGDVLRVERITGEPGGTEDILEEDATVVTFELEKGSIWKEFNTDTNSDGTYDAYVFTTSQTGIEKATCDNETGEINVSSGKATFVFPQYGEYECKLYGMTEIGDEAFNGSSVKSVIISPRVTHIGQHAFAGNINLENIILPDGLTNIASYAFYVCNLKSIIIPKSVTVIGEFAFSGCHNLTIYCEAESKPDKWDSTWNDSNRPVVWGYSKN